MSKFFILLCVFFCQFHLVWSACVPSPTQCGCSHVQPLFSAAKIVGGYVARNNSWPWMVSFRHASTNNASASSPGSAFCGGTLINSRFILTAAHCFSSVALADLPSYFAVVGGIFRNDTNPVRFNVRSVLIHYLYNSNTQDNDIALVEMDHSVDLTDPTVGFICLPPANNTAYPGQGMNGTAIGWGSTVQGGSSSLVLRQVSMPIIPPGNELCDALIDDGTIEFCAGLPQGGEDTCQGDSGGPLMTYNSSSDTWIIAGITSYGDGCALPQKPGVYTRVSAYIDWINNYVHARSRASVLYISNITVFFMFSINLFF